jgi:hypothetical protein
VWVANRDEPITHPNLNLSQLKISSDGNLVIVVNHSSYTQSVVWSTHIVDNRTQTSSINTTISAAVLLNTGNLALTSEQKMLWQSFDYPTDVGLPGAKFGRNKVTGLNRQGISRKSLIDPGIGSYSLELVDISGIILKRRNNPLVVYWRYASSGASALNLLPILKSLFDLDPRTKDLFGRITYVNNNQEEYYMYTLQDETSSSVFVSLDISGQIKLNIWSQANQSWQPYIPSLLIRALLRLLAGLSRSATAMHNHLVIVWRASPRSRCRIGTSMIEQEDASEIHLYTAALVVRTQT